MSTGQGSAEGHGTDEDDPAGIGLDPAFVAPVRLRARAAAEPDRPFLTEVAGSTLSYAQVLDRALRWSTLLLRQGVMPGDRVASFLPSSHDAVCLWFACAMVGAVEVPVNPELRGTFLTHVLTDSGVRTCVVRPEHRRLVEGCGLPGLEVVVADRDPSWIERIDPNPTPNCPLPADPACVIYTSGTTGPSKGVVVTWAQLSAIIGRLPRSWFGPDDVAYAPWPMFHVTGRSPVIVMLDAGGTVVLKERFSLSEFWTDVCDHGVTNTTIASVVRLLADAPGPACGEHPLRLALTGSDSRATLAFGERFGVRMCGSYGSTEIGFPVVNRRIDEHTARLAGWPRRGYHLRVVDQDLRDVPQGEVGELLVKPPARELMLREYLGQPELTARAVVDGWFRTGDGVRLLEDGSVLFVDRLTDTIRRFGENISSIAVESAVAALPSVAACAVVGVPSPASGKDLLLVVVPALERLDPAILFEDLRDHLPRHALPSYIVMLADLPRTANGKTRKTELVGLVEQAWPSPVVRRATP